MTQFKLQLTDKAANTSWRSMGKGHTNVHFAEQGTTKQLHVAQIQSVVKQIPLFPSLNQMAKELLPLNPV